MYTYGVPTLDQGGQQYGKTNEKQPRYRGCTSVVFLFDEHTIVFLGFHHQGFWCNGLLTLVVVSAIEGEPVGYIFFTIGT